MKLHASTYEHERLQPNLLPIPRASARKAHLLPAIAALPTPDIAETVRRALEAIAQDGGCSIDYLGGLFFVRKAYIAASGRAVGVYNCRATRSLLAEHLADAMVESRG